MCARCGDPVSEGLGDPATRVVCLGCAIVLRAQCTDGDRSACDQLRMLNALAEASARRASGQS
jgi:hypothetical protein